MFTSHSSRSKIPGQIHGFDVFKYVMMSVRCMTGSRNLLLVQVPPVYVGGGGYRRAVGCRDGRE